MYGAVFYAATYFGGNVLYNTTWFVDNSEEDWNTKDSSLWYSDSPTDWHE